MYVSFSAVGSFYVRTYVRNLYVTGRSHLFGPARFWLDSRFVLLGWSCLVGHLVPVLWLPGSRLVPVGRLVVPLVPVGYQVCPSCWAAWLPVGWPVNPGWRDGWSRLTGGLVWSCIACSCFVWDPCSVHELFYFFTSRHPQQPD